MLAKIRKFTTFLLSFLLFMTVLPPVSFATEPLSSQDQITDRGAIRYYDAAGSEVVASPVLGNNAVVSVAKTIEGTETENEFKINLEVKTSTDISEVRMSRDAAVVIVLDVSGSMGSPVDYMPALKAAAINFLESYAAEAGGAVRYASLVTFSTTAQIVLGWTDVTDSQNLESMNNKINSLSAGGGTFIQGGLMMARNLLRTDALPAGTQGGDIENRSVILFSDGQANFYTILSTANYRAGTAIGKDAGNGADADADSMSYAVTMANTIKNETSFTSNAMIYEKYVGDLYTVAFGSAAPAAWLSDNIATNSTYAYSASNPSQLNDAFAAIEKRIESWAEAWVVTDPMGKNIEFISGISPNDRDTGLLNYENNTLSWDLKKASPSSFDDNNNIYTYRYTYRVRLDTTGAAYTSGISYSINGKTELTYVMVSDGRITSDTMVADFFIPAVKGYAGNFGFTKVGGNTEILAGCEFTLTNQTKAGHGLTAISKAGSGEVRFADIPSGHTYLLSETSMPDAYKGIYRKSAEELTVTVSYGNVVIRDSQGNDVTDGFNFNNPLCEKPEKKVVSETGKDGAAVTAGDKLAYQISYENYEEIAATVVIVDELPVGVDFVSAGNGGVYDEEAHTVTWTLTGVAGGHTGYVSLVVEVSERAVEKIENTATVKIGDNAPQISNKTENIVAVKYGAAYEFVSSDASPLPQEVLNLLPGDIGKYDNGAVVTAVDPAEKTVETDQGVWRFIGWDAKSKTIAGKDILFIGTWEKIPELIPNPSPEPASIRLTATKRAEGRALIDGAFNFAVFENGAQIASGTNTAAGVIRFSEITYTEPGRHTYTVRETSKGGNGWTTDVTVYTVTVTVSDNGDGTLSAQVGYPQGGVVFINRYEPVEEPHDEGLTLRIGKRLVDENGARIGDGKKFAVRLYDSAMNLLQRIILTANGDEVVITGLSSGQIYYLAEEDGSFEIVGYEIVGYGTIQREAIGFRVPVLNDGQTRAIQIVLTNRVNEDNLIDIPDEEPPLVPFEPPLSPPVVEIPEEEAPLVPPESIPETGDGGSILFVIILLILGFSGTIMLGIKRKTTAFNFTVKAITVVKSMNERK